MLRRAIAGLFAAALLVLAPSAAFAAPEYSDDDFDLAVSTTNPAPGETFTVSITAPSGVDVTLTVSSDDVSDDAIQIAGTKSLTKTSVDGQAVFSVTLSEEGTFALVATDAEGNVLETATVVVGDPAAAPTTPAPGAGGGAAGPTLPETGATATPLIIGGALLLLVGGAALFFARRAKVTA